MVTIDDVLDIRSTHSELICFVGAGGKTTTLFKLARELKHPRKKVLVTTTTAIFYPDESDYDEVIVDRLKDSRMFNTVKEGRIVVLAREVSPENKLLGIDREFIEELYKKKLFHYILVEGDGSKQKPIKA
ncbi:MAG: putative selenium-dependent hydroxylase accessory protein YqeC, partial [Deltaproteobacteria bacterium]|nr:putative selenium-dependent hydroxylase accessory protein YqeC [Deltaproteobacteria bacterium]